MEPIPLIKTEDRLSRNPGGTEKLIEIIKRVKEFTGTTGTWAIDRQGDNINLTRLWRFT
jgi:hypothetical protein